MKLDILAIGAHPDDIELCCSGTLAAAVDGGASVGILDLTEGELGTRGTTKTRTAEAKKAASILGVHTRINLRLRDGDIRVDRASMLKVVQVLRKYRPEIILIPYRLERHPDHMHAHQLCKEASFYSGLRKIITRDSGKPQEAWRPRSVFQYMQWYEFSPSFLVDISKVYERRMKAILSFSSQFYNPSSKEPNTFLSEKAFLEFIEARARLYGGRIGVEYAEPFYTDEYVGVRSLFDLQMSRG